MLKLAYHKTFSYNHCLTTESHINNMKMSMTRDSGFVGNITPTYINLSINKAKKLTILHQALVAKIHNKNMICK